MNDLIQVMRTNQRAQKQNCILSFDCRVVAVYGLHISSPLIIIITNNNNNNIIFRNDSGNNLLAY